MMKRITAFLIMLIFAAGIAVTPAYAKNTNDIVNELIKSDVVFETFAELGAVVESGDVKNIFMKVLDVYPLWIEQIRAIEADTPYSYTSDGQDKADEAIVKDVLARQVIHEDFVKLVETERTGDAAKIMECVNEIYPDIVRAFVTSTQEHNNNISGVGTILSNGGSEIVCAVGGIAVGFVAAWLIFRRKKRTVSSPHAEDEASEN